MVGGSAAVERKVKTDVVVADCPVDDVWWALKVDKFRSIQGAILAPKSWRWHMHLHAAAIIARPRAVARSGDLAKDLPVCIFVSM